MAKFRLHLDECGLVTEDEEGVEAASPDEARAVAIDAARDIMAAEVRRGSLCLGCSIEIVDERDAVMDRVPFRDALTVTGASPPSA